MKFECQRCGACCRWPGTVRGSDDEMSSAAALLGISLDEFIQQYTELDRERRGLVYASRPDGACIFLNEDNSCRIYAARPWQCRAYPKEWDVPPEYQKLCGGRQKQLEAMAEPIALAHVLGHPGKPMDVTAAPADAQVLNCRNMCLLLEHLKIPYVYYGFPGSVLPGSLGTFADCGRPTGVWKYGNRWHQTYNQRLSRRLRQHARLDGKPEVILSLYGAAQADIDDLALPVIEPMVGYDHCWADYRVFPSYCQQSVIYTRQPEDTERSRFFDTVIPHFMPAEDFQLGAPNLEEPYLLFIGRADAGKGQGLAERVARAAGMPLKIVHNGLYGEAKARLIGGALAVLMPTLYLEPFGYVAIEAQLCGTPVITTDWGAFAETVRQGQGGFRCRTQAEWLQAVALASTLDRTAIRKHAIERFSLASVADAYNRYFQFVWNVHQGDGYFTYGATRGEPFRMP